MVDIADVFTQINNRYGKTYVNWIFSMISSPSTTGRPGDAPLLARGDGTRWADGDGFFHRIVAAVELDESVTGYCLRHSLIVRQILTGIPLRVVAASHDTSTDQIEKNYSRFIVGDASDTLCRRAMLDMETAAPASNVVKLGHVA